MPQPLAVSAPYPEISGLNADPLSVRILSPAYASPSGELNSILQYLYHSFSFACSGDGERANLLKGIAYAEMRHFELIGQALISMGAQPVYTAQPPSAYNFYSTKYISYSRTLKDMLEDDIIGEKHAVYVYERMLSRLKNDLLKRLICRILEDENMHLEALTHSLGRLSC